MEEEDKKALGGGMESREVMVLWAEDQKAIQGISAGR